ncbi:uncharacterized protein O9250_006659 [Rhynochetos jubatus]
MPGVRNHDVGNSLVSAWHNGSGKEGQSHAGTMLGAGGRGCSRREVLLRLRTWSVTPGPSAQTGPRLFLGSSADFITKKESSCLLLLLLPTCAALAHAAVTMLPKLLFVSGELGMFAVLFQKINVCCIGGASKGRKRGSVGRFHTSAVAFMNLAWDFVTRLFLHSDSIEDFC